MIRRLLNYINKESEIKRLRRDVDKTLSLLSKLAEVCVANQKEMNAVFDVINAREEMLTTAVLELQEKSVYEQ